MVTSDTPTITPKPTKKLPSKFISAISNCIVILVSGDCSKLCACAPAIVVGTVADPLWIWYVSNYLRSPHPPPHPTPYVVFFCVWCSLGGLHPHRH
jgi:hypothetical protein